MKRNNVEGFDKYTNAVEMNRKYHVRYPLYVIVDNAVVKLKRSEDDYRKFEPVAKVCNAVYIVLIKSDVESKVKTCVLRYLNVSGKWEKKECGVDALVNERSVVELSRYGVDVTSSNAKDVAKHMSNQLRMAKTMKQIGKVGFVRINGKFYWVGHKCLTERDGKIFVSSKLQYSGKLNLERHGDYETYKSMLKNEVFPSPQLTTILCLGLSAPLIGYFGKEFQVPNIIAHLSGDSSSGKTTALKLAATLFGSPVNKEEKNSVLSSWNVTENALLEMMAGNQGIPIALDEAGMKKDKNFGSLIYRLHEGKDKIRLKFGEGNTDVREWHTTIISSGEIPLNDHTDAATGQGIRLLSFEGVAWTTDAEHSQRIVETLTENYGFLGERFVKAVFKTPKEKLRETYYIECKKVAEELKCGKFNERLAKTIGVVMLACRILCRMHFPVDAAKCRDFLVDHTNQTRGTNSTLGARAYELLMAEISKHQNQIERRHGNGGAIVPVPSGDIWAVGYGEKTDAKVRSDTYSFGKVAIQKHDCDRILEENGFRNPEEVYRQWKGSGFIELGSRGEIIHKIKFGNVAKAKCIKVIMGKL